MGHPTFRPRLNRYPNLGQYRLRLDPWIQWQIRIQAMRRILDPAFIRAAILRTQPDASNVSILGPPFESSRSRNEPLVPRGEGPSTPREASWKELLDAILKVPDVKLITTRVQDDAVQHLERVWDRLTFGERFVVLTTGVGMLGLTTAGIMENESSRARVLDSLGNQDFNLPGIHLGGRLNTGAGSTGGTNIQSVSVFLNNVPVHNIPGLTMQIGFNYSGGGAQRLERFMLNLDLTRIFPSLR